jgi:RNA-binding protein Luc7-like 2
MDRKIQKAKDRAEKESAPRDVKLEDQIRLDEIQAKMKGTLVSTRLVLFKALTYAWGAEALEKASRLGEDGDVDGSLLFAQQADNFKLQHESLFKALTAPDRTMTVCDVCGVFINSTDNEQRRKVRHYLHSCMLPGNP